MSHTPGNRHLPSHNSALKTAPATMQHNNNSSANGTTITMMLANRITHPDEWAVDDEHFYETNTMNVWQTLEFLSGLNLRKRYHYEGYSDTENIIGTLTPSWRRDSFAEKAAVNKEESSGDGSGSGSGRGRGKMPVENVGGHFAGNGADAMHRDQHRSNNNSKSNRAKSVSVGKVRFVRNKCGNGRQQRCRTKSETLDPEYVLLPTEYNDLVKCNFNIPRISAALERLIGTNVVRLTDHKFMTELRQRLEEDSRIQLERRINARALREVERERLLIIEGKTNEIPEELAEDPIFVVNKIANKEIQKERAKLKTNRERNAERLKAQGSKWERERQKYVEEEQKRVEKIKERKKEQTELEEQYKGEDAERGMDLLRIDNEEWRECEQDLKRFLEEERAKMKERSLRVPTPFTSDKLDILNIVRARKKFREAEQRICKELEEGAKPKPVAKDFKLTKELAEKTAVIQKHVQDIIQAENEGIFEPAISKEAVKEMSEREKEERQRRKYLDDASDVSTESEIYEHGSTISESKRRHAAELEEEMEYDVERGYLISKAQFEQLRYHDDKILMLQKASDMRELYQLAEEIIIGERVEEEIVEEEMEEEEEQPIYEEVEEEEPGENNF